MNVTVMINWGWYKPPASPGDAADAGETRLMLWRWVTACAKLAVFRCCNAGITAQVSVDVFNPVTHVTHAPRDP